MAQTKTETEADLLQATLDAVNRLFADRSVTRAVTRERLEEVQALVESSLEALDTP